jgi:DNA repair ATPase RecN
MNFLKNRHLLFGVVVLALVSMLLCVALFVSERGNEYQIQNLSHRLEQTSTTQQVLLEKLKTLSIHEHRFSQIEKRLSVLDTFETHLSQIEERLITLNSYDDCLSQIKKRLERLDIYEACLNKIEERLKILDTFQTQLRKIDNKLDVLDIYGNLTSHVKEEELDVQKNVR